MNKKLEQMAEDRYQGASLEEVLQKHLGEDIANLSGEIQKNVHDILTKASDLEEKYAAMDMRMAVFQEIDERCGDNIADSFRMISDWKYITAIRNLELSEEELKEQGMDTVYVRDMLVKTRETEQEMAKSATKEELDALRDELSSILPVDVDGMKASLKQMAADESWDSVLEKVDEAAGEITDQARKDMAVLSAALFLSEHPERSSEEAAAAAAIQIAESEGAHKAQFVWMALPVMLALAVSGIIGTLLGVITGLEMVTEFSMLVAVASASMLSLLALVAIGRGTYHAVKKAIPYIKSAWEKSLPYVKQAASKVKNLVAGIIGVVTNHVFRPAIHWISNTAIPVIREKVYHPLKRRLIAMLEWLREKKNQVVDFIRNAAAPADAEQAYADDLGFIYSEEDEEENEYEFT